MNYLVDTDWVADYLKGRPSAVQFIDDLAEEGLAISILTFGEIYEGIYSGRDPVALERSFRLFLRGVDVLTLNRAIVRRFAETRGSLRRSGQLPGDIDLLIAATALHHGLIVITRNVSHFSRVPGLRLHNGSA